MQAAYLSWDMNPVLLSLGSLQIRWYGLMFALAFLSGYQLIQWVYKREGKPLQDLDYLFLYMVVGTIVGARLGHCFFYRPVYFLHHPLEILMIWRGGLASHGAAIGILTSLYIYSRRHRDQPYLWLLSRVALPVALAGVFIRIGNFFNSEIVGIPATVPWAVQFLRYDYYNAVPRHPAQLYESLAYLLVFLVLLSTYLRRGRNTSPALLLGLFFSLVFTARFFIEFVKELQAPFESGLPLHMGQMLSIPLILIGLYLVWQGLQARASEGAAGEHRG